MGYSTLVGIHASLLFLGFLYLRHSPMAFLSFPFLHASLVSALVAVASHTAINLPLLLGKTPNGTFPIWSFLIFGPCMASARIFVFFRRLRSGEAPYNEVSEGLYVGGWPSSLDRIPPGDPAIVDCTCELPRNPSFAKNPYMCIPTWDTRAPRLSEIESAVGWACRKRSLKKPVFIHCAFGHGRSVLVMCALLVALGLAEDWKHAEKIIKERRPSIRMNALHRKTLDEWSKCRLSTKSTGDQSSVNAVIMSDVSKN